MNFDSGYCAAVKSHYELLWGSAKAYLHSAGPWKDLSPGFSVLEFSPTKTRHNWTYATCCMSSSNDIERLELHMFAPHQAPELVELLTVVAHFHRTGERLNLGHSVNFGRPWLPDSKCTCGLVSLPYLDGPNLELGGSPERPIRFLWLVPITQEERGFKAAQGLEKLEELFEKHELDYANPGRASVV